MAACVVAIAHYHYRVRPLSFALAGQPDYQIPLGFGWRRLQKLPSRV